MRTRLDIPAIGLALVLVLAPGSAPGQEEGKAEGAKSLPAEQIEQLVAPIALHPDDLLSQILMASTYPLEVVEAARWVESNKSLKGDPLAEALKLKGWDPSVKSLVNVPQVLDMMNKKLDWMQALGNAFLAQKEDVMAAIQKLRKAAMKQGNLKSSDEIEVKDEGDTIVIECEDPDVVYVPVYDPGVVYWSTWPYPSWPPYYYYPPGWRPVPTPYAVGAGIAIGVAWGYAWGHCHWGHSDIDIDIDRNVDRNRNIDRNWYKDRMGKAGVAGGKGSWRHDANHRRGVGYSDPKVAQRYNRGASPKASSREAYRGRSATPTARPTSRPSAGQKPASTRRSTGGMHSYGKGSTVRQQSARGHSSRQSSGYRGSASRGGSRGGARGGGGRGGGRR